MTTKSKVKVMIVRAKLKIGVFYSDPSMKFEIMILNVTVLRGIKNAMSLNENIMQYSLVIIDYLVIRFSSSR